MSSGDGFTRLQLATESSSDERLFDLFCNYLSLGQWELARQCLRGLKSTAFCQQRLRDVLSGLLANSSEASQVWQSVASPCHLSWLCLKEWVALFPDEKALVAVVQPRLEFVLLLQSANAEIPQRVYNELIGHHECLLSAAGFAREGSSNDVSPSPLSSEALTTIKHLLHCQLSVGRTLAASLSFRQVCRQSAMRAMASAAQCLFFENDQLLQGTYMQCISERLTLLNRKSAQSCPDPVEVGRLADCVYGYLSAMDPSTEMIALPLDALFTDLLLASVSQEKSKPAGLCRRKLYSCLVGRKEPFLIDRFCKVEDHMLITRALPDFADRPVATKAQMTAELPKDPLAGGQVTGDDGRSVQSCAWHKRFFSAFQDGEHFLEALLKLSLQLVREKKLQELRSLLQPPEFSLLRPLLMLLGWELCNNLDEASQLLKALWSDMDNDHMPEHLQQACQRLAYQVHLVEWCRGRAKSEHSVRRGSHQAADLFEGFQSHSVLFVLHASTSLAGLDPEEVKDMLQHRPLFGSASHSPHGLNRPGAGTVRSPISRTISQAPSPSAVFSGSVDGSRSLFPAVLSRSSSVSAVATSLSMQQERDIAIYHSFCAVQDFMSILVTCIDPNSLPQDLLHRRQELQRCRQLMVPQTGRFQAEAFVAKKLAHAKECLASTYPLNYRLEVLENIFSLLFLQYSDVYSMAKAECSSSAAESDPQPPAQGDSRLTGSGAAAPTVGVAVVPDSLDSGTATASALFPSRMFVASEGVVRQALSVLKDCLVNLTSAKFAQLSSFSASSSPDSTASVADDHLVRSSVDMSNLQSRITRLDQSIQEAKWRLALVASASTADVSTSPGPVPAVHVLSSSSDESTESECEKSSSDSDGKQSSSSEVRRPQRKRRRQRATPSSSHRSTPTSANSRESTPTAEEKLARSVARKDSMHKMIARKTRRKSTSCRPRHRPGSNVIPQMLSTPESLLHSCLKRRRFERAREVIKMFKLEGDRCAEQVNFSERLLAVREKLSGLSSRASAAAQAPFSMCGIAASMRATKSASPLLASHGRQASMAVSELLSSSAMPKSLYLDYRLSQSGSRDQWLEVLSACLPSLVAFDLVTTCQLEQPISQQLLTMALERFQGGSKEFRRPTTAGASSDRGQSGIGSCARVHNPAEIMQRLLPLVSKDTYCNLQSTLPGLASEGSAGDAAGGGVRGVVRAITSQSLHRFLVGGVHSLSVQQCLTDMRDMEKRWLAWYHLLSIMEEHGHVSLDVSESVLSEDGQMSPIRSAIQAVLEAYEDSIGDQPHIHGVVRYLLHFFSHVEKLSSLLLAAQQGNDYDEGSDWNLHHRPVNPLAVLKESPTVTLGRLMFDKQLPPSKVEGISADLGLDLVQIIMQCCCPPVPSSGGGPVSPIPVTAAASPHAISVTNVLNSKRQEWLGEVMTPLQLSVSLLTKALALITAKARVSKTHAMDAAAAAAVSVSAEWREIEQLTGNLSLLDLAQALDTERRVFFYTNVLNLILAHCAITLNSVWPADGPARILLLKTSSYYLGQLGLVSAFDMWHIILRGGQPCMAYGHDMTTLLPGPTDRDPWKAFIPAKFNPRTLFLISDCSANSPLPKVLDGEIVLNAVLSVATSSFLASTVEVVGDQVILPCQLDWFREDITAKSDAAGDAELVRFAQDHLLGEKFSALQNLAHLAGGRAGGVNVSFSSFDWNMQYLLPSGGTTTSSSSASAHIPSPNSLSPERTFDISGAVTQSILTARYLLTSSAMEYLQNHLPLAAALANLVCPRSLTTSASGGHSPKSHRDLEEDDEEEEDVNEDLTASIMAHVASLGGRFSNTPKQLASTATSSAGMPTTSPQEDSLLGRISSSAQLMKLVHRSCYTFGPLQEFLCLRAGALPDSRSFAGASSNDYLRLLQSLILSPRHSAGAECAVKVIRDYYLRECHWHAAVSFVDSELCLLPGGIACDIPDMWLEAAAIACHCPDSEPVSIEKKKGATAVNGASSWRYVFRMKCADVFVRAVLRHMYDWPIDIALNGLEQCSERLDRRHPLHRVVREYYMCISVYRRVRLCALQGTNNSALNKLLSQTPVNSPRGILDDSHWMTWRNWTAVQVASEEKPELVVQLLLKSGEFKLVGDWSQLHRVLPELLKAIEERYILSLLQGENCNLTKAFRALESIQEKDDALRVCENIRPLLQDLSCVIFVVQYQLNCLDEKLSRPARENLIHLCLGAQALLCLPAHSRGSYERLMAHPQLLIEQLLMNMKVDWAELVGKCFRRAARHYHCGKNKHEAAILEEDSDDSDTEEVDEEIANAFSSLSDPDPTASSQFVSEIQRAFDDLVGRYAEKALEFPSSYVPPLVDASSRSSSVSSLRGADGSLLASESGYLRRTPTRPLHPSESPVMGQRSNTSTPHRPPSRSSPAPRRSLQESFATSAVRTPGQAPRRSIAKEKGKDEKLAPIFQPPLLAPTKTEWIKDETVPCCMVCQTERFSMFNRRHHCRRCGRVVCQTCSMKKVVVEGCGNSPVRACDQCYATLYDPAMRGDLLSGTSLSSDQGTPAALDEPFNAEALSQLGPSASGMALPLHDEEQAWALVPDDDMANVQVLDEFYFDQSPSVGLCLSILALHGDGRRRGHMLVAFTENMSNHMRPVAPGVENEEVDHYLVISMMQKLLMNAKMEFLKAGDMTSIERCDTYLGYAELLRMLVADHYKDIPSLQELANQDSARLLRNRLLEDDRPELAVEVSTKCNLDTQSVWMAWAKACFASGQYVAAREKLSHCWKPRVGKAPISSQQQAWLNSIVDYIETGTVLPLCSAAELLAENPSEHLSQPVGLHTHLDSVRFAECLHYLHQYGTPLQLLQFLQRHNMLNKACALVLDKEVSEDVFIEGLAGPCLRRGTLRDLLDQMMSLDSTLNQWDAYLMGLCRHLSGKRLHSSLYHLQVFMRDYVRAAMTCIKFFTGQVGGPPTTYKDMHGRLPWLRQARDHLRSAIDRGNWSESVTVNTSGWQLVGSTTTATATAAASAASQAGLDQSRFGASMSYSSQAPSARGSIYDMAPDHDASLLDTSGGGGAPRQVQSRKTMPPAELTKHMNTIKLQVEVVEFLHGLETSSAAAAAGSAATPSAGGGGASAGSGRQHPLPSLFSGGKAREELAAQVVAMDPNVDEGFKLAQKIAQDFRLNNKQVLCTISQRIAKQREWKRLDALLRNMQSIGMTSGNSRDDIIMAAVRVITKESAESKQVEKLVGMLQSCDNKVSALVDTGKLKNAYLVAVKAQRPDLVRLIGRVAKEKNQPAIIRVCEQFLSQQPRPSR